MTDIAGNELIEDDEVANGTLVLDRSTLADGYDFFRLLADSNGDAKVDGGDIATWQVNYDPSGVNENGPQNGDWNLDGLVSMSDLAVWQSNHTPIAMVRPSVAEEPLEQEPAAQNVPVVDAPIITVDDAEVELIKVQGQISRRPGRPGMLRTSRLSLSPLAIMSSSQIAETSITMFRYSRIYDIQKSWQVAEDDQVATSRLSFARLRSRLGRKRFDGIYDLFSWYRFAERFK